MKATVTSVLLLLLVAAAPSAAQTGAAAQGQPQTSPALQEAARLTAEVVRLHAAGKYAEALPLAERALELREKGLGETHPQVGGALLNLASVERNLGKADDARRHYKQAAAIFEKGGEATARSLINAVEGLARMEPDIIRASELHKRTLALKEKTYGPDSPEAAPNVFQLGHFSDLLRRYDEAERYFLRFVQIAEKTKAQAGVEDDVAVAYTRLACLMRKKGKRDEADAFESSAAAVFKSAADKRQPFEGGVVNGKALSKPQPSYPAEAKRASAAGTIEVEILVGETGVVLSACAQNSVGHKSLKESSEFAAYNARFTPTSVDGKPVKVRGIITYRFVLR
jgi:TonB family protein